MSSILKALKKIEGRKVETRLPIWLKQFGGQEIMDSQIRKSRQRQKILGALIILCVAVIGIKLYSGWHSKSSTQENSLASNVETPIPVKPPASATETDKTAPPDTAIAPDIPESLPVASAETAPAETKTVPEVLSGSLPPVKTTETPAPAETKTAPEVLSGSLPPVKTTETPVEISPESAPPSETEEETSAPAVAATDAPASEVFIQTPANNAGLALHALVWSKNPNERFVVINGTILREGASIEGVTIVRIEKEYAVMKGGEGLWKLR